MVGVHHEKVISQMFSTDGVVAGIPPTARIGVHHQPDPQGLFRQLSASSRTLVRPGSCPNLTLNTTVTTEAAMADLDALRLLIRGVAAWNQARAGSAEPADLTSVQVLNADLRGANFQSVDFNHSDISGSDLRDADLARSRLNGVTLERSSLESANLTGAEILGTSIWRVCLRRAVLAGVRTADVRIRDSILRGANLSGANMAGAHMHNCDLTQAVIDNTAFDAAFLKRITAEPELLDRVANGGATVHLPNLPLAADRVNCADFRVTAADADFGLVIHGGQAYWIGERRWDFFISHASADKQTVAEPLARALTLRDQRVWLDANQVGLGDSLEERISFGINGCLFGVVILSRNFFHRYWTEHELENIVARRKRIFVVLHDIDRSELETTYPQLRDLFTASTADGIDRVADELIEAIRRPPRQLDVVPEPAPGQGQSMMGGASERGTSD